MTDALLERAIAWRQTEELMIHAEVGVAPLAAFAPSAVNGWLDGHTATDEVTVGFTPNLLDDAHRFVPEDERDRDGCVSDLPIAVEVHIGATHAHTHDPNDRVTAARRCDIRSAAETDLTWPHKLSTSHANVIAPL